MIAVIADDFTGAAEIGGVGLKYGLRVVIETEVKKNGSVDLLVISADTRSLPAKEASNEIEKITRQLLEMNPDYIYKKLDSVLRGNILEEIEAQLKVTGKQLAVMVAGNPSFGRVIENGVYRVNSIPLAKTSFANDPDFPVSSSVVTDILGECEMPVYSISAFSDFPEQGIVVGDVKDESEMNQWADKIDKNLLPAGGAGFFNTLMGRQFEEVKTLCDGCLSLGKHALFVFGSKFPRSLQLPLGLLKNETIKLNMPDEIYRNADFDPKIMNEWVSGVVSGLKKNKRVIVTTDQDFSEEPGLSARIKRNVAELVKQVMDSIELSDLLIEGGATTSEILRALNISKLYPKKLVHPGIIQLQTEGTPKLTITTKPGSYPWPDAVKLEKREDLSMEPS